MGADIFLLMRDSAEQQLLKANMRWERLREWLEGLNRCPYGNWPEAHAANTERDALLDSVMDKMDELEAADV